MTTLSVVIPALNEQDGIAAIVRRVLDVRPNLGRCAAWPTLSSSSWMMAPATTRPRSWPVPQRSMLRHPQNRGYGGPQDALPPPRAS